MKNLESKYMGLDKKTLWVLLCKESGPHKKPITAYGYSEGISGYPAMMIGIEDKSHIPEVFKHAEKWRWDSPGRRFHYFEFNSDGVVINFNLGKSRF